MGNIKNIFNIFILLKSEKIKTNPLELVNLEIIKYNLNKCVNDNMSSNWFYGFSYYLELFQNYFNYNIPYELLNLNKKTIYNHNENIKLLEKEYNKWKKNIDKNNINQIIMKKDLE